jgi:serine/threonine protein kinase
MAKQTRKKKKRSQKIKKIKKISGGKVIAFGGSGCVFYPALNCDGKKSPNTVSKLMGNREANKEYENIMHIRSKILSIPNYEDYFLLDVVKCKPDPLTESELRELSKCSSLFTNIDINDKIDNFTILNMPNGGPPIDDYIYDNGSFEKIYDVHIGLSKLLVNGIIPMNRKNIFHCDIKDSNVLIDSDKKVHLIDWGLYAEYEPFVNAPFPQTWRNRPFQYNVPFSVILFSDSFTKKYENFIKDGSNDPKRFAIEYINSWMKERGPGHYKFINETMTLLFSNELDDVSEEDMPKIIETQITMDYIVNYIVDVLVHFTDGLQEYLDTVFTRIVDIWGLISAYHPILEVLSNSYSKLTKGEMKIFKQLQFIFVEYLYNPRHEPIDMDVLLNDLNDLGKLIHLKINGSLTTYESPVFPSEK